ncbi:MAG: hypothetical protein RQ753_05295 [Desulfurivibrionaceae bacterium]|nr:hypothetical protein [Desulfurivibrionaceae bacterium]
MAERKRINERLIGLVCLGIIALNYPFLDLFSKNRFLFGVPLLYLYIFSLWLLFILALGLVIRRRRPPASVPDPGPDKPD